VAAVDINMGCPKHFSVHGGMGAALLRKPEVACDVRLTRSSPAISLDLPLTGRILALCQRQIIKTLRRNLNIPISCKIRLLEDTKATVGRRLGAL
jgi:tRNA-dihydrouridine synthase 2